MCDGPINIELSESYAFLAFLSNLYLNVYRLILAVKSYFTEAYFLRCIEDQEEEIPKWAHFIRPSHVISYGINAMIKAIRKRRQKEERSKYCLCVYT